MSLLREPVVPQRPPRVDDGAPLLAAVSAPQHAREVEHAEPAGRPRRDRRHGDLGPVLAGQRNLYQTPMAGTA